MMSTPQPRTYLRPLMARRVCRATEGFRSQRPSASLWTSQSEADPLPIDLAIHKRTWRGLRPKASVRRAPMSAIERTAVVPRVEQQAPRAPKQTTAAARRRSCMAASHSPSPGIKGVLDQSAMGYTAPPLLGEPLAAIEPCVSPRIFWSLPEQTDIEVVDLHALFPRPERDGAADRSRAVPF